MLRAFTIFCLLMFSISYLKAFDFSANEIIQLELINGTVLTGRVIDHDAHQLQIVGYELNRLVPFSALSEASRKEFNLPEPNALSTDSLATFAGLNTTRDNLLAAQSQFYHPEHLFPLIPAISYAVYPLTFQPCTFYYHAPHYFFPNNHSSIQFGNSSFFFKFRL